LRRLADRDDLDGTRRVSGDHHWLPAWIPTVGRRVWRSHSVMIATIVPTRLSLGWTTALAHYDKTL
jgi:hypothetical protein